MGALLEVKKNDGASGASPTGVGVALESAWQRYYCCRADGAGHKTDVAVSALSGSHRLRDAASGYPGFRLLPE